VPISNAVFTAAVSWGHPYPAGSEYPNTMLSTVEHTRYIREHAGAEVEETQHPGGGHGDPGGARPEAGKDFGHVDTGQPDEQAADRVAILKQARPV
jgi:hypothetical protein